MWGVIIFDDHPASIRTDGSGQERMLLLLMVDVAVKRYANYKGNRYPKNLSDLLPRYVPLQKKELSCLDMLSYSTDTTEGYRLALGDRRAQGMCSLSFHHRVWFI